MKIIIVLSVILASCIPNPLVDESNDPLPFVGSSERYQKKIKFKEGSLESEKLNGQKGEKYYSFNISSMMKTDSTKVSIGIANSGDEKTHYTFLEKDFDFLVDGKNLILFQNSKTDENVFYRIIVTNYAK